MSEHLRLTFLPVNRAWCLTLGDAIFTLDNRHLFTSREAALEALTRKGLGVSAAGRIVVVAPRSWVVKDKAGLTVYGPASETGCLEWLAKHYPGSIYKAQAVHGFRITSN